MFSEQDVDRELQAVLSVSPSPEFEARVLQRVEADRPAWRPHYGWLAAAASLVIAAGVFYALNRPSSVAPAPPAQRVEQAPRAGVVAAVREPPVRRPEDRTSVAETPRVRAVHARSSAPRRAPRTAPHTAEPEVIVPLNQMAAVRRLVRAVNEGRLAAPAEPPQGPMAPPETVAIVPIVVEPIVVAPVAREAETPARSVRSSQ